MYYARGIRVFEKDDIGEALNFLYGDLVPPLAKQLILNKCYINNNLKKYFIKISNMATIMEYTEKYDVVEYLMKYLVTKYGEDQIIKIQNSAIIPPIAKICITPDDEIDNLIFTASGYIGIHISNSGNDKLQEKIVEFSSGKEFESLDIKILPYFEPYEFLKTIDKIYQIF